MGLGYHLALVGVGEEGVVHRAHTVNHDIGAGCNLEEVIPAGGKMRRCADGFVVEHLECRNTLVEADVGDAVGSLEHRVAVNLVERRIHGVNSRLGVFHRSESRVVSKIGVYGFF